MSEGTSDEQKIYNEYCKTTTNKDGSKGTKVIKNNAGVVAEGVGNALLGMIYPDAFGDPLKQPKKDLKQMTSDVTDTENVWKGRIDEWKEKIKDEQNEYYQDQLDFIQTTAKLNKEIEDDKISENTLLIQIVIGILIIIIIYLIVL